MRRIIFSLSMLFVLSGCATQYQSRGFTGGHTDQQGPGKLYKIVFAGNGFTSDDIAQKYVLYRSAEIAQSLNKPFFIMYHSLTNAALGQPSNAPSIGIVLNRPTAIAFILPLDVSRAAAHDTKATLHNLRDVIAKGQLPTSDTAEKQ